MKKLYSIPILLISISVFSCFQDNQLELETTLLQISTSAIKSGEFGNIVKQDECNREIDQGRKTLSPEALKNVIKEGNNLLTRYPALSLLLSVCAPNKLRFGTDNAVLAVGDYRQNKAAYYDPAEFAIFFREAYNDNILFHEILHACQHQYIKQTVYTRGYARALEYEVAIIMDVLEYVRTGSLLFSGTPNGDFQKYYALIKDIAKDGRNAPREKVIEMLHNFMKNWGEYRELESNGLYDFPFLFLLITNLSSLS